MSDVAEVVEIMKELCNDKSIPKNVRSSLIEIESIILDNHKDVAVRVDSALHILEGITLDPNLSSFARTQIWELTCALESINE